MITTRLTKRKRVKNEVAQVNISIEKPEKGNDSFNFYREASESDFTYRKSILQEKICST
jgi:hypothetical protein